MIYLTKMKIFQSTTVQELTKFYRQRTSVHEELYLPYIDENFHEQADSSEQFFPFSPSSIPSFGPFDCDSHCFA